MSRDIVIVGGGPSGISTALALVAADPRLCERIVILEKGVYPRDKYCAGGIGGRGLRLLASLGAVPDVPFVPIHGIAFRGYGGEQTARIANLGRVVRRIEFDHALAKIAMSRGIVFEQGVKVLGVTDRGRGDVVVTTTAGERSARIVVGADGVGSVVRRSLGLSRGELTAQVIEIDTERVSGDLDGGVVRFDGSDPRIRGYTWDFPTLVLGEAKFCRGIYALRTGNEGADELEVLFQERLAKQGLDLGRYRQKRFAERGFDPRERLAEGGRMLVGEGAGIDPVTGEGIAQAIECGVNAGGFIADALAQGGACPDLSHWTETLRRSRLGIDLRVRRRIVPIFYGAPRRTVERFLFAEPDALYLGCQHFGGEAYDYGRLARLGVKVAAFVGGHYVKKAMNRS